MTKTIALITGSGVGNLEEVLENPEPYYFNDNKSPSTMMRGTLNGKEVYIFNRHGESEASRRTPAQLVKEGTYERIIWEFHELGVEAIYATSAVGALDTHIPLGNKSVVEKVLGSKSGVIVKRIPGTHFILPHTYVRGLAASQHTFGSEAPNPHPMMNPPFNKALLDELGCAISKQAANYITGAMYIYNGGDDFETPEEVLAIKNFTSLSSRNNSFIPPIKQNRLVGMTVVPEVMLAAQVSIPYAPICVNVNYAGEADHEKTLQVMRDVEPVLTKVLAEVMRAA